VKDFELDPRTKLVIVLVLSSLAVIYRSPYWLVALSACSTGVFFALGTGFSDLMKRLKRLIPIIIIIVFIQSVFRRDGNIVLSIGSLALLTDVGIKEGISVAMRFFILILSAGILISVNPQHIIRGLVDWKVPYELIFMVQMGIRFLPLLREELNDAFAAIQLRGVELVKVSLIKKVKIYSHVFMPSIANALVRTNQLTIAMELRGFGVGEKRSFYHEVSLKTVDKLLIFSSIFLGIIAAALYYKYKG
jgi:energy-coupling factor transport system permease protein